MDKLNEIVKKTVEEYEIENINEFAFTSQLSQMIFQNYKEINIPKYRSRVPLKKSIKYSYDFLDSLSHDYSKELENLKSEIIFEKQNLQNYKDAYSDYDYETAKKIIYIPYSNNIGDSYNITHEIIHATSINKEFSYTRNVFCESLSFLAEMLQKDYLKENNVRDYQINDKEQINGLRYFNIIVDYQLNLINEYLNNGYIDISNFMDILKKYSIYDISTISNYLLESVKNNEFDLNFKQRYIIGYPLACYMYDRVINNGIHEFIELNEMINEFWLEDFLNYIDLECEDKEYLSLTKESYDEIEKSFVKRMKMI